MNRLIMKFIKKSPVKFGGQEHLIKFSDSGESTQMAPWFKI